MDKLNLTNNHNIDLIIKILDKLVEYKKIASNTKMDFSEKEMFTHIAKSTEISRDLFKLIDEFETSMGDPSYLRDEKFWG